MDIWNTGLTLNYLMIYNFGCSFQKSRLGKAFGIKLSKQFMTKFAYKLSFIWYQAIYIINKFAPRIEALARALETKVPVNQMLENTKNRYSWNPVDQKDGNVGERRAFPQFTCGITGIGVRLFIKLTFLLDEKFSE